MEKTALRRLYIQKRKELSALQVEEYSKKISQLFATLPLAEVNYLHTYYPIPGKTEVDCLKIVQWIRQEQPQIQVVLSKSNLRNNTLEHYLWKSDTPLFMNKWGITEPQRGEIICPEKLDLILIPLLAFDEKGNRVGYGKGFYDRFLSECRKDALKVGLSFFDAVENPFEVFEHDVPLDICITSGKIWEF